MNREKVEKEVKEGNISLIVDSYIDIFSSFDPRPYSERSLSQDFLMECQRASIDKEVNFDLRIMVPKEKRKLRDERQIKKRLIDHFKKHFAQKQKDIRKIKAEGFTWFFLGILIMISASFLYDKSGFLSHLLLVIAEPAGWFTFWEGLDKVFITSREQAPEYEFYKKMSTSHITFVSY